MTIVPLVTFMSFYDLEKYNYVFYILCDNHNDEQIIFLRQLAKP